MNDQEFDRLQRFFDGDLPAKDAEEVRGRVAADAEWGIAHDAFGRIRAGLRERAEIAADSADFGELWRRVDAALPAEPAAAPASAMTKATVPSLGERLRAWWAAHWTPVVVSAVAAALVAVVVTRALMPTPSSPATRERGAGGHEAVAKNAPEKSAPEKNATQKNVVVDAVRNEGNKTVLINMPMAADGATVIWLLDDEQTEQDSVTGEDPI